MLEKGSPFVKGTAPKDNYPEVLGEELERLVSRVRQQWGKQAAAQKLGLGHTASEMRGVPEERHFLRVH